MLPRINVFAPSDPEQEREFQKFYSLICRHLVCLGLHYVYLDDEGKPKGKEHFYAWTCFVVCFHDVWCLATAGHAVRDFDQMVADKKIKVVSSFFADHFGKGATFRFVTPVSYEDLERPYVYDEQTGTDFATIRVSDLYRAGFQKNGIIPIPPEVIALPHNDIYQAYVLLGFPKEVTDRFTKPIEPGEPRNPAIVPVMISVRNIEDYSEIPDTVPLPKTKLPMFVGHLTAPEKINVKGMSGGPIFAIRQNEGTYDYRLVAIQSGWFSESRIITAYPAYFFASIVDKAIFNSLQNSESDEPVKPD